MRRWIGTIAVSLLLSGAAGCATTGAQDPRDPLEGFNRAMYSFNEGFDNAVAKPVATAYRDVLPEQVKYWVRNFFANIADIFIGANNLLQGKAGEAIDDWTRFAFNTTVGLFGINDVASEMGLEKHDEDFGQTFGRWGMPDGAYLVWPFFGPSDVRDTAGLVLDWHFDPVTQHKPKDPRYFMIGLRFISKRADLLDASRILEEAALDKYVFQRDAYLQRRRSQIYDGNPPRSARQLPPRAESEAPQAPAAPALEVRSAAELLEAPASAPRTGG